MEQKRVIAIHDISGFGKCSLTVALPIISACGIECAAIPTAVLSTHTGGFKDYTFRDLTDDILPFAKHWKAENITADTFYTGYLGSIKQVGIVKQAIDMLKTGNSLVVVDPAMADNGRLYSGFSEDFPAAMLSLCGLADVIVPNITEAALLVGKEFKTAPHTKEYIEDLLTKLNNLTGAAVVLTGVDFGEGTLGAAIYDQKIHYVLEPKIPHFYHGTGDVFASVLTAALTNGKKLYDATALAAEFVSLSIQKTIEQNPERTYGVNFESALPILAKNI